MTADIIPFARTRAERQEIRQRQDGRTPFADRLRTYMQTDRYKDWIGKNRTKSDDTGAA